MKLEMKKVAVGVALAVGLVAGSAQAALAPDAILSIDGPNSQFQMEVAAGFWVPTAITGLNGITLGEIQTANGAELEDSPLAVGNIDNPWNFFGNTGVHKTTVAPTVVSDDGAGNVSLDFSGWAVSWSTVDTIDMSSGGTAAMVCAADCSFGETYTIDYAAVVPSGDPSGFGNVAYELHLEGTVNPVPIPAAAWLFGSALLGLVGVARRKKA